jgi:transcriptional regulator NrdR family protein
MAGAFPLCPRCSAAKSAVVDTRLNAQGYVRRRRKCLTCEHRWSTWEIHQDEVLGIKATMAELVEKLKGFRPSFGE